MTLDDLYNIIVNCERGNNAEIIKISKEDYESLKKENKDTNFNAFHGPFGTVRIEIKE